MSAPSAPAGFVLVPVEPTEEMLGRLWLELGDHPCKQHALEAWEAALKVAPAAPQAVAGPSELLIGAVARGWCTPENSHKVMDSDLALAIAREVAALAQPAAAPMSDEQIGAIYQQTFEQAEGCVRKAPSPSRLVIDFARAILAAASKP